MRRVVAVLVGGVAFTVLAFACSSVPDIRFEDADANGSTGGDGGGSTGKDGATEAAPPVVVNCPSTPPVGGVCCGKEPCYGCSQSSCSECLDAGCPSGEVCCQRGPNNLRCETDKTCAK